MFRFFDQYPIFYRTGRGLNHNRLNYRYQALIETNRALIAGARVLDVASHNGRWTLAALSAGASHAIGVEPRAELVAIAEQALRDAGQTNYRFIIGDIHREIAKLDKGSIDVVLLFGFFYHTIHHYYLLSEIKRLGVRALILDTEIDSQLEDPIIRLRTDDASCVLGAISEQGAEGHPLVGLPSRAAVELMLQTLGYEARHYDWHNAGITDWEGLDDYRAGERISLVATPIAD